MIFRATIIVALLSFLLIWKVWLKGNFSLGVTVLITKDNVYQAPILYVEFHYASENKFIRVSFNVEIWERKTVNW